MATNTSRSCERGRTHRVYATRHAQFANRASFRLFTFWPTRFHAAPSFSSRLPFSFSCLSHALFGARMRALLDRKFVRFAFVWSQWTLLLALLSPLSPMLPALSHSPFISFRECVRRCVSCQFFVFLVFRTFSRPIFYQALAVCGYFAFVELYKVIL